jgi:hypothetical protein
MAVKGASVVVLEQATFISDADPGAEDKGWSHWENHVVEVHWALEREFAKIPYLVHQLSVFDDRQPITGVLEMVFNGLRQTQELDGNARDGDLY